VGFWAVGRVGKVLGSGNEVLGNGQVGEISLIIFCK